ncbi:MAG: LacI family DNA-binding transcriptional regulator [Armatimonadota bacterium]
MPPKKPPTLQDVAARAGVSSVAVSVVLNGTRSRTKVSEQTRVRILAAAQEINYHPNRLARFLLRGKTDIVGVYLGHSHMAPRHPFLAELLSGLQEQCQASGQNLLLLQRRPDQDQDALLALLMGGIIDGLILVTPANDPLLPKVAESTLPAILVADISPLLPSLLVDDSDGFRQILHHLVQRGHRRVMYLGGEKLSPSHARRWRALASAAAEADVTLLSAPRIEEAPELPFLQELIQTLALPPNLRPSALIGFNDAIAHHVLEALLTAGIAVPQQVSVTGFDGYSRAPGGAQLTTVKADWAAVGRLALQRLQQGEEFCRPGDVTMLPIQFFPGDTT